MIRCLPFMCPPAITAIAIEVYLSTVDNTFVICRVRSSNEST